MTTKNARTSWKEDKTSNQQVLLTLHWEHVSRVTVGSLGTAYYRDYGFDQKHGNIIP
jgi:hypothetical protein